MPADGWTAVKADEATVEGADEIVAGLARTGLVLSRAQVLSAVLAKGVREFRLDPGSLFGPVSPRKRTARTSG